MDQHTEAVVWQEVVGKLWMADWPTGGIQCVNDSGTGQLHVFMQGVDWQGHLTKETGETHILPAKLRTLKQECPTGGRNAFS